MELIKKHKKEIFKACTAYQVETLFVFGSILTDSFNVESDIDLIVSISSKDPLEYAENYFALKFKLEKILNRKIDLLEQKAIKNQRFKKLIDQKKILVYGRGNSSMA